jgi:predicted RecA/RadA family phage recombinase
MATNKRFERGDQLSLVVTNPASPVSGDPVRFGQIVGVATTDERTDGTTSVDFAGVYALSVKAEDNAGNSAVALGDRLYYEDAATPKINKDNVAGVFAGFALETITSGSTATIQVRLSN